MRYTRITIATALPTQDVGNIFKTTTRSMHGIASKLGRAGRAVANQGTDGFGYYTPQGDEFSVLDDDPATFTVGVNIPTFTGTNGGGVTLHMYVWDRDDHREVQFVTPHGVIGGAAKSRRRLQQLVEAIQKHDAGAKLVAA